jgi:prepilin-type N-terminal cleavage/methylation domain-containing protein
MARSLKFSAAFSLIETLIAIALLSISFAGVYALLGSSAITINNSINKIDAQRVADSIIEDLHTAAQIDDIAAYNNMYLHRSASSSPTLKNILHQKWYGRLNNTIGPTIGYEPRMLYVSQIGDKYIVRFNINSSDNSRDIDIRRVLNAK